MANAAKPPRPKSAAPPALPPSSALQAPQPNAPDGVIAALLEHQPRPIARGLDVLRQISAVDALPDLPRLLHRLVVGQAREAMEERPRVAEYRFAQQEK